jgi:hypothetical protein
MKRSKFALYSKLALILIGVLVNNFLVPHVLPLLEPATAAEVVRYVNAFLAIAGLYERFFGGDDGAHAPLHLVTPKDT